MRAAAHLDLGFPFRGTWLVQNSPANRLPSHGTTLFASCCAIDFVPVDQAGRSAPIVLRSLTRSEPPERFPGFGRPILSPCDGVVVTTHDGLPDHHAYRGWSSLGYALGQRRRATAGWIGLAGNHVAIDTGGAIVFLCHLRQHTVTVHPGQRLRLGEPLAECGNTGNSTEPHLHLQAVDSLRIDQANAVPITFRGSLPRNGHIVDVLPGGGTG
jgi:hypothetical protein